MFRIAFGGRILFLVNREILLVLIWRVSGWVLSLGPGSWRVISVSAPSWQRRRQGSLRRKLRGSRGVSGGAMSTLRMMGGSPFWTMACAVIMVLLISWQDHRILQGNVYSHVTGKMLTWILGNPIRIKGAECYREKAIYIFNHHSPIDVFLIMWLVPSGTIGIAKKETIWYPLFGQLYVLANHLRTDRSNQTATIVSLKEAARAVVRNKLSLIITTAFQKDNWTADRIDAHVHLFRDTNTSPILK